MVALVAYFILLTALGDVLNVRLGIELLTAAVLVAALAITRRPRLFLRDWWFFLIGLLLWNLSGPVAAGSPFPVHIRLMPRLDRAMFLGHQPAVVVQHALVPHVGISPLMVAAAVAYNLHLSEPYFFGYILWRLNRAIYLQFAASVLTLLVLGLVTFILFPVAPPWYVSRLGMISGVRNLFGVVLHADPVPFHGSPLFTALHLRGDAVAAFPSEHAALPALEMLFYSRLGRWGYLFILWIGAIVFSVVFLGQHWVTDIVAGWLYAVVCFALVRRVACRRHNSCP